MDEVDTEDLEPLVKEDIEDLEPLVEVDTEDVGPLEVVRVGRGPSEGDVEDSVPSDRVVLRLSVEGATEDL